VLGDWAERRNAYGGIWLSGIGLVLAAPFVFFAARIADPWAIYGLSFAAQFLIFLNTGPLNAAIVNCVSPAFRAFAMGINVLMFHLLGDALSPTVIGAIAKRFSIARAIELNSLPVLFGGLILLLGPTAVSRALRKPDSALA
jgi:hypothetical protein